MKLIHLLAISGLITSPALGAPGGMTRFDVQAPCRSAPGLNMPCVVVTKTVSGDAPMVRSTVDMTPAKILQGQNPSFAIVYNYKVKPGGYNSEATLALSRGSDTVMGDISSNKARPFWIFTRDGGRTWSKVRTTNMDGALSY